MFFLLVIHTLQISFTGVIYMGLVRTAHLRLNICPRIFVGNVGHSQEAFNNFVVWMYSVLKLELVITGLTLTTRTWVCNLGSQKISILLMFFIGQKVCIIHMHTVESVSSPNQCKKGCDLQAGLDLVPVLFTPQYLQLQLLLQPYRPTFFLLVSPTQRLISPVVLFSLKTTWFSAQERNTTDNVL